MEKNNKIGRPTEAKKDITIKVRIDEKTQEKIDYCKEKSDMSASEIIRQGISKVYQELKGDC